MCQQYDIKQKGLDEQIKLYGKDADEAQALMMKKTELEQQYQQQTLRYDEDEIQRAHAVKAIDLQLAYEKKDINNDLYHDDIALAEDMYKNDIDMLKKRQSLYRKDSQEWLDIEAEISQRQREQELDRTQRYNDLLERYKEDWAAKDVREQERITLKGLDLLHEKGLLKEIEYQEMMKQIKLRYAEQESEQSLHNSKMSSLKVTLTLLTKLRQIRRKRPGLMSILRARALLTLLPLILIFTSLRWPISSLWSRRV